MASVRRHRSWLTPFLIAGLALLSGLAQAQTATGVVVGVVRGPTGDALSNVSITVAGTNLATTTDTSGAYRLSHVPAGDQTIVFTYLGLAAVTGTVKVAAGETVTNDAKLSYSEAILVSGSPIIEGQAKALNTQENAVNITNVVASDQMSQFPDRNAAESTQRLPAVSLLRDQGEGRYVLVRGTEQRLNSTTVNGERIPASESDVRTIALDTIPADLLESIEVSKALTPDMDGDAIGGSVDLVTKRAPLKERVQATLGGGWDAISKDTLANAAFTWGRRFSEGKTGLLLSLTGSQANRGSDDFEPAYVEGNMDELSLRDYTLTRERYGITGSIDRQFSTGSEFYLRGLFNLYKDSEIRRNLRNLVTKGQLGWELRDRTQTSHIDSVTAGGSAMLGESVLNYHVAWNKSSEETPDQLTTTFTQKKVKFAPNVTPTSIDPNNIQANPTNMDITKALFNKFATKGEHASERDYVGSVDLTKAFYRDSTFSGLWKFGAKARFKDKDQSYDSTTWTLAGSQTLYLTNYLGSFTTATPFIDGRYTIPLFEDPKKMRDFFAQGKKDGTLVGEYDLEASLAGLDAKENTIAAYGMAELDLGANLVILAGVRAENTHNTYDSHELIYDEEGNPSGLSPISGKKDYTTVLPMVHLKYKLGEHSNFRAAVTRSFARPDFFQVNPNVVVNHEGQDITKGNPDLKATTAWNLDLLFEHYLPSVGILSAGVFYKQITDNIYTAVGKEFIDGVPYEVTQPVNAEEGWLRGLELAYQARFSSLPKPLDGLGLYFNYTYADSKSSYPGHPDSPLPGQAQNVGNVALTYEKAGFSGRVSVNYNGKAIFFVGTEGAPDQFVDNHTQLDFSAQQSLGDKIALFLEVNNLTNEPYRVYEGTTNRPLQEEYYRWWGTIGLKFNF
jgi:TonB-dependent receptor